MNYMLLHSIDNFCWSAEATGPTWSLPLPLSITYSGYCIIDSYACVPGYVCAFYLDFVCVCVFYTCYYYIIDSCACVVPGYVCVIVVSASLMVVCVCVWYSCYFIVDSYACALMCVL